VTLEEETLVLRELRTGRREGIHYPGFHDSAAAVAVTGDGKRIVAAYRRRGIRVYDLVSGSLLKTLGSPDLRVAHMFIVPGRPRVVATDMHQKTHVFDAESGECLKTYDWDISSIDGASLSRNGRYLVNHNLNTGVWLRDLETGHCLLHFKASSQLGGVALDDRHIITGTQDHRISFWDLKSGSLCATLYNVTSGFLWEIPPGGDCGHGWLWTDREDLIQVAEFGADGEIHRFLMEDDPGRRNYLRVYNNRKMVMSRLRNPEEYKALAARHRAVVEGETRRFRHEVVSMLPGPSPSPHL
jgi:WD40 repeat protein